LMEEVRLLKEAMANLVSIVLNSNPSTVNTEPAQSVSQVNVLMEEVRLLKEAMARMRTDQDTAIKTRDQDNARALPTPDPPAIDDAELGKKVEALLGPRVDAQVFFFFVNLFIDLT